jgi:Asp-tRNA(Asn)/Glu-tRNA(Gln) amidotransferase B subunit
MRQVLDALRSGKTLKEAVGNAQVMDIGALEATVKQVVDENPDVINRYKAGETKLIGFLTGQVMKKAGGGADPSSVAALLNKLLAQ